MPPENSHAPEIKSHRMQTMVTPTMLAQLEAARVKLGYRASADVVREAIEMRLAEINRARPSDRYAGRTRLLVDTAPEPAGLAEADDRPKRVAQLREPARLRPLAQAFDRDVRELAEITQTPTHLVEQPASDSSSDYLAPPEQSFGMVEAFDQALAGLGFDPDRIATDPTRREPAPADVCLECFCLAPAHAVTCSLASDAASA